MPNFIPYFVITWAQKRIHVKTNVKDSKVVEVLQEFVRSQMGLGRDSRIPLNTNMYTVKIALNMDNDHFSWEHDCGNEALGLGIVMDAIGSLTDGTIKPEPFK